MKQTLLLLSFCCLAAAAQAQNARQSTTKSIHANTSATVSEAVEANAAIDVKAVERISATNVINRLATATYTAGKAITLQPGFEARAGSVFAATIAPVSARSAEVLPELTVSAWPNPFSDKTIVEYNMPENSTVKHTLTDARGSLIRQTNSDGTQAAGTYKVGVEGSNLPTGVYLYQLQTGTHTKTIRLLKQ